MKGIILYLIASITTPIFNKIGIIFLLFSKDKNKHFKDLAISKDQYTNVALQIVFNKIMITKESKHLYGNPDETLSSVYGKNKRANTLTKFGKFWARFLNKIEKDHVEMAIEDDENL